MPDIECTNGSNESNQTTDYGKLLSSLPKEALKSLLYLVSGKPDSNIKIFNQPIVIDQNDIAELNQSIQEKLTKHQTPVSMVTVDISYNKNKSATFGNWQEFLDTKWNIPNIVESIAIKWDFFVLWPTYGVPQRHTLSVKIASKMKPMQILQAVFSKDPDEVEDFEIGPAPVMCRVDFIDHLMSEELINIVEKWVDSRKRPDFITPTKTFLKKWKRRIAELIHYSTPTLTTAATISVLYNITCKLGLSSNVTVLHMRDLMAWLMLSLTTIFISTLIGKYIASKAYTGIDNYGQFLTFSITNGDKNRQSEITKKNSRNMAMFIINCCISLILNIVAGIITFYMLTPPSK